jgi:hypothetical protein
MDDPCPISTDIRDYRCFAEANSIQGAYVLIKISTVFQDNVVLSLGSLNLLLHWWFVDKCVNIYISCTSTPESTETFISYCIYSVTVIPSSLYERSFRLPECYNLMGKTGQRTRLGT